MKKSPTRFHLNVAGDFYVEYGCCTLCGVPATTAPRLFGGFEADGSRSPGVEHCWVARQPTSEAEVDAMLETMTTSEFGCVRYCGRDPKILSRLREAGAEALIDGD